VRIDQELKAALLQELAAIIEGHRQWDIAVFMRLDQAKV
jgi:hypothetical protein